MRTKNEVEELIDKLFTVPESETAAEVDPHVYPEQLLHIAPQGNKYNHSLQQYKRQFLDDLLEGRIIQFSNSKLNTLLRQKVRSWEGDGAAAPETLVPEAVPSVLKTANALFSWSSGDLYIQARKEQLRSQSKSPAPVTSPTKASFGPASKPSLPVRLHQVVDSESHKFIQDRIDVIKAHRLEQASKRVSERKQRDHDRYMERMKKKEEEYDKALNAAIKLKKDGKNQNFFGTLFSFGKSRGSSGMDASDNNLDLHTISSSKNSMESTNSRNKTSFSLQNHPQMPVTPNKESFKTSLLANGSPAPSTHPTAPEPQVIGIDDAFSSMSVSPKEPKGDFLLDDLLGLPSPPKSKDTSPQKHKFIPLGAVPKKSALQDPTEDLLKL